MHSDLHSDTTRTAFATRLEELDFFRYAQPHLVPRLRARLIKTGNILDAQTRRVYFADEERLAECGIRALLREIRPVLTNQGVFLRTIEEDCHQQGYTITINQRRFTLYSSIELEADRASRGRESNIWDLTGRRMCALVNHLLAEHHSSERLYSLYGGNDHLALFLTQALYELIRAGGFDQIGNYLILYRPDELPEVSSR
jgi:hypothetical protein